MEQHHFELFMEVLGTISSTNDAILNELKLTSTKAISLQSFVCKKEAMIADNRICELRQEYPKFSGIDFILLADEINNLKESK